MRIIQPVIVWKFRFSPESQAELRAMAGETLSAQERTRAGRFHFERDRFWFSFFHEATRYLLSSVLPGKPNPASIQFEATAQGKPFLKDFPDWQFNLTHSSGVAALAVSICCPVGIDLEELDQQFPAMEVAREFFIGEEIAWLEATDSTEVRTDRFFQLWTAKEAVMKFTGLGMTLEPRMIEISFDSDLEKLVGIRHVEGFPHAQPEWQVHQLECGPDAKLTLVCPLEWECIQFHDLSNVPPAEWLSRFADQEPPK